MGSVRYSSAIGRGVAFFAIDHIVRAQQREARAVVVEGGRLPVPMRYRCPQPLPAWRTSIQASHLGAGAGLVDEHQCVRVEIELRVEPRLAPAQNVGTILLGRMPGLFLSVIRRRC